MQLTASWVQGPSALRELADDWEALAALDPSPFNTVPYYETWLRSFHPGAPVRVAVVRDDGRLVAALPGVQLGTRFTAMANSESALHRPLFASHPALHRLAEFVMTEAPARFSLASAPLDDEATRTMLAAARTARRVVMEHTPERAPIVDTSGSWDSYRTAMKSKWHSVERKLRKMDREHRLEMNIMLMTAGAEEVRRGLELENDGWKGREGSSVLADEQRTAFYTGVADTAAAAGQLSVSEIFLDGRLVAFDLNILAAGRLYLLKTTYDEKVAPYSPGVAIRYLTVKRCFELGLDAHELLGKDEPWKQGFATGYRRMGSFELVSRTPATLPFLGYHRYVKPAVKASALGPVARSVRDRYRARAARSRSTPADAR